MKLHEFLLPGAALFCLLALLLLPEEGAQAARDALALCAQTVVPSLFPFFVLSALTFVLCLNLLAKRIAKKWKI